MIGIPTELRDLYADLPKSAHEDSRIASAWLRKKIRPTAIDDAVLQAAGVPLHPQPFLETCTLSVAICERMEWGPVLAASAAKAEWRAAEEAVRKCEEDIRRAVWPLAKIRASGHDMIAAANAVCERSNIIFPGEYVLDLCRRIALATVPAYARPK